MTKAVRNIRNLLRSWQTVAAKIRAETEANELVDAQLLSEFEPWYPAGFGRMDATRLTSSSDWWFRG